MESAKLLLEEVLKGRVACPDKILAATKNHVYLGRGLRPHHVQDRVMVILAPWATPESLSGKHTAEEIMKMGFAIALDLSALTDTGNLCGPGVDVDDFLDLLQEVNPELSQKYRDLPPELRSVLRVIHGSMSLRTARASDGPRVRIRRFDSGQTVHGVEGFVGSTADTNPECLL